MKTWIKGFINGIVWPMYLAFTGVVVLVMGMVLQDTLLAAVSQAKWGVTAHWFPVAYIGWVLLTGIGFIIYGFYLALTTAQNPERREEITLQKS